MSESPFCVSVKPDWEAFVDCIRMKGTPDRVHFIELFLDAEIREAICARYGVADHLDPNDEWYEDRKTIALQRFLGYDYVCARVEGVAVSYTRHVIDDTAELAHKNGRGYIEEHKGPITTWDEFENYDWPDPADVTGRALEWYEANLPDDMCLIARGTGHLAEYITWLMGYESLCYALFDNRDLVAAIRDKIMALDRAAMDIYDQSDRCKIIWSSDDLGFKTGPLISPDDMREYVFPGHKINAERAHAKDRPYLLHACGNLSTLIDDLVNDVRIDAKHSFEDVIEDVREAKHTYGKRIALLGGIDVDFLARADEERIRARVREVLETCHPGGGFCLGSGNSVANYIPVDNYLAMLDEGRKFTA